MKKIYKLSFLAASCLLVGTVNVDAKAYVKVPKAIENDTYIIGTHAFTKDRKYLSTREVMLAAKTVEGTDLEDMVIYYKDLNGEWYDASIGKTITSENLLEEFKIEFTNSIANPNITFSQAKSTTNFGNSDKINQFMLALFGGVDGDAESTIVEGITVNKSVSINKNVITIDGDKITPGMQLFIKTNYDGSSIPIAIAFDKETPEDIKKDTNWDNKYLVWVNLDNIKEENENYIAMSKNAETSYIVKTAVENPTLTISKPIWNAETPNKDNMNEFMTKLWNEVISFSNNTLTVKKDKITEEMMLFINANYGGSSIPVKLAYSKGIPAGQVKDENWSDSYLLWIDLKTIDVSKETKTIAMVDKSEATYSLEIAIENPTVAFSKPVWIAETPNKENMNKLMNDLWNTTKGVISVNGNTITINRDNITKDMLLFIKTNYDGSSVPLKITYSKNTPVGSEKDKNWSDSYLVWVDIKEIKVGSNDIEIKMNDKSTATYKLVATNAQLVLDIESSKTIITEYLNTAIANSDYTAENQAIIADLKVKGNAKLITAVYLSDVTDILNEFKGKMNAVETIVATALKEAKIAAITDLNSYFATGTTSVDYSAKNLVAIKAIRDTTIIEINKITDITKIAGLVTTAKAKIDDVKTIPQELVIEKATKVIEINNYFTNSKDSLTSYTTEDQAKIVEAKKGAVLAINAATDTAGVLRVMTETKVGIDALSTIAENETVEAVKTYEKSKLNTDALAAKTKVDALERVSLKTSLTDRMTAVNKLVLAYKEAKSTKDIQELLGEEINNIGLVMTDYLLLDNDQKINVAFAIFQNRETLTTKEIIQTLLNVKVALENTTRTDLINEYKNATDAAKIKELLLSNILKLDVSAYKVLTDEQKSDVALRIEGVKDTLTTKEKIQKAINEAISLI